MSEGTPVEIKPAKGRPFLQWVGKQPLRRVIAYPAQKVKVFAAGEPPAARQAELWQDRQKEYPHAGLLKARIADWRSMVDSVIMDPAMR